MNRPIFLSFAEQPVASLDAQYLVGQPQNASFTSFTVLHNTYGHIEQIGGLSAGEIVRAMKITEIFGMDVSATEAVRTSHDVPANRELADIEE